MHATTFVVLSGTLTFGVPLALALRELFELKRRGQGGWEGDGPTAPKPKPPPVMGQKPLPDCLIPRVPPRRAVRIRELEEV